MTAPTRAAGWGRGPEDGTLVTWTVAEGRKGRRWREVVARGADVVHALLLETDPNGRFSHLELARADGLWTFHPEVDGTLHGNHVRVRHRRSPHRWAAVRAGRRDDRRRISPVSLAAIAWGHAAGALVCPVGGVAIGDGRDAGRAGRRVHRAALPDALAGRGGESDRDRRGRTACPRRWRTVAAGARIDRPSWTACGQGPPRREVHEKLVDKSVSTRQARRLCWSCSKGPWTESSVADANQRCWLRTSGSFGRFCFGGR